MNRTLEEWTLLARTYLAANAGHQISGMTHNANNFCHVLEMQLELFQGKIRKQPDLAASELAPKFGRLTQAVGKLAEMLKDNEQHTFYTEETSNMIDINQFIAWLNRFWTNNLFFKHKIITTITCADNLPTLQLPPFFLTLCLDEALKNAVEACNTKDPSGQHACAIDVAPHGNGALFSLTSPTILPVDINPWAEGSTSNPGHLGLGLPMAKYLAEHIGWKVYLRGDKDTTTFCLEIPELRTR